MAVPAAHVVIPHETARRSTLLRWTRVAPVIAVLLAAAAYGGWLRWKSDLPRQWFGTIEADQMRVGSRVGGRVHKIAVVEGDRVEAGQVIVEFEGPDLEAQLLTAQGQLEEAEAVLSKLQAGARPDEAAQAEAHIRAAAAAFRGARVRAILGSGASGGLSGAQLQQASANQGGSASPTPASSAEQQQQEDRMEMAAELLTAARRADLAEAQAEVAESTAAERLVRSGTRLEDIRAANGRVLAARGAFNRAEAMIGELTVRAPRAARVEAVLVHPGDIVPPNAPAVTLIEDDQPFVRVYIPETQLGYVHVGDHVLLAVDSFPKRDFAGLVENVSTSGEYLPHNIQTVDDRANQVFATRVRIVAPTRDLRAGMAASIRMSQ